jgi:hypothetical protein
MRTIARVCRYRTSSAVPGSLRASAGRWTVPGSLVAWRRIRPHAVCREMRYPMGAPVRGCCGGPTLGGHRGPEAGDWLSGRAPRSHRGGHWFDPSIAHPAQRPVAILQLAVSDLGAAEGSEGLRPVLVHRVGLDAVVSSPRPTVIYRTCQTGSRRRRCLIRPHKLDGRAVSGAVRSGTCAVAAAQIRGLEDGRGCSRSP